MRVSTERITIDMTSPGYADWFERRAGRARSLLLLLVSLELASCSASDEEGEVDLSNGCDITKTACQQAVFDVTAWLRGGSNSGMPAVRVIGLDEFAAELEQMEASAPEDFEVWNSVLPLLELLPEGGSVADEMSAVALANVAAFYQVERKEVTVIDRGASSPRDDMFFLAHEFVHALQDQELDLSAFLERWATSTDAQVAVKSLIEGEATLLSYGVLADSGGHSVMDINWPYVSEFMRESVFRSIVEAPAPLFAAITGLPYALGSSKLPPLLLTRGQSAFRELYPAPPSSVLDWGDDTSLGAPTRVEPLDCVPTLGPPGFSEYESDALGPTGVLAVGVALHGDIHKAWSAAFTVRGDRLVSFTDDDASGERAVAWRIRFRDRTAAEAFVADVTPARAVGSGLVAIGSEVLFYGTTNPATLPLWTDATQCGAPAQ
jgi:hypothetical protein